MSTEDHRPRIWITFVRRIEEGRYDTRKRAWVQGSFTVGPFYDVITVLRHFPKVEELWAEDGKAPEGEAKPLATKDKNGFWVYRDKMGNRLFRADRLIVRTRAFSGVLSERKGPEILAVPNIRVMRDGS
jgi:hypothetical protein